MAHYYKAGKSVEQLQGQPHMSKQIELQETSHHITLNVLPDFKILPALLIKTSVIAEREKEREPGVAVVLLCGGQRMENSRRWTVSGFSPSALLCWTKGAKDTAKMFLLSHVHWPVLVIWVSCIKR